MRKFVILLLICCFIQSCADKQEPVTTSTTSSLTLLPPSRVRLDQICRAYANGDYTAFVGCMHSCRKKPESYITQMEHLFKQRFARLTHDSIEISNYTTNQIIMHDYCSAADVYLDVSYSNGRQEELFIPMVYDDGKWWVK